MASLTGTILGKYQITERLGRGGMAEVYQAYHPQLERYAAIKVLHGFLAEGQDFQMRFQREAKAIAALRHPNIVQIYDIDRNDEYYYMVMEYIDGGTLKDRMLQASGPLPINAMAHIFGQIASALDYAHRQGVLHRDIKPANVLLDRSGRVVLTDFGIARIVSETQFTVTGTLVGTPAYMSPEQGKGMPISNPSDIYSLGIILYEMVTGKVPFDADTPLAVIHKHINEPLPLPRTLREDIPTAVEDVILKALSKEPEDRYQTANEMMDAANAAFKTFEKLTLSETMVEIPDLEVAEVKPGQTIASKETVAMPPEDTAPEATIASKTTVAMEPKADIADKDTVAMEAAIDAEPIPAPAKKTPQPRPKKAAKVKPMAIIGSIALVALVAAALIWGLPKLSANTGGEIVKTEVVEAEVVETEVVEAEVEEPVDVEQDNTGDCTTPDECHALAEELWGNGDIEGVVATLDQAISLVPDADHPAYAQYWCMRAEALIMLERHEEAIWNFEDCMAWTEDNPDLEDLRVFAQEQINVLSGDGLQDTGESVCATAEECFSEAEMLRENGDIPGAIDRIYQALPLVPEEAHPQFHFLWCTLGELHMQLENWDEARGSFEECIVWTEGDPGLEDPRVFAQEQIDLINNR